ncbi:MAG: hypothetical protein ACI8TP_003948 [Acidimicrobiales bacterium]|jgi:hypothetical protein
MTVTIGVDPHKVSNTIAVLESDETVLLDQRFENSAAGFVAMLDATSELGDRLWAVEGAFGIGRGLAQRLVAAGEVVVDVPAKLSAQVRVYSQGHGRKTDSHGAIAVAKAALHPSRLRRVSIDGDQVALELLVDRRRELTSARTQAACRLHRLFVLDPATESDEEAERVLHELLLDAAIDAEAAGWDMDQPQANGLRLRGRFENAGPEGGFWWLTLRTGSHPNDSLTATINYYLD